jgi:hypothetical protein
MVASNRRVGGDRADPDDGAQARAALIRLRVAGDACIARSDGRVHARPMGAQLFEQGLECVRQQGLAGKIREQPAQGAVTLRNHHAELGQDATQPVADRQRFGLVALAHPVPRQAHLLIGRLHRHETHVALARRRCNRFGIVAVILCGAALAERRHELRRHDPRNEAEPGTPSRPLVRAATGLHRHHGPGRQLRQQQGERIALEVMPAQHTPRLVHLARREHVLRQIHACGYSAHGDFLCC